MGWGESEKSIPKDKKLMLANGLRSDLEGEWLCDLMGLIMCKIVENGIREINSGQCSGSKGSIKIGRKWEPLGEQYGEILMR